MKTIEQWRWRVKWAGKWCSTRHHATEEAIRKEHPEAERLPGTMRLSAEAETPEELRLNAVPPTIQREMDPLIASAWSMPRRP